MTTSTSFAQMANNQSISLSSALRANTPPIKKSSTSRKFLTLSIFFLLSFFCTTNAWGAEELVYTLTPANGSNNSYAGNCDITISGIKWNLTGNSQEQPWRIGGKSLTKVDRAVYSKTAMPYNISKIEITHGTASSITVNSFKLIISDAANDSGTEIPVTFKASATTTIELPAGDYTNKYFKFLYNVTVSGSNNKYLQFTNAKFYAETAPAVTYEVTWKVDGETYTEGSPSTSVSGGSKVTQLPTNPDNCSADVVFVGWTESTTFNGTKPSDLFSDVEGSPVINKRTTFYAVFAKREGEQKETTTTATISGSTSGSVKDVLSWSSEQQASANAPTWNTNDSEYRFYYNSGGNGCSMTIDAEEGVTITGIKITASSTSYRPTVKYNVDGGSDQTGSWSSTTMAITELSAASFKFRNANTANTQLRFKNVVVTYSMLSGEYTYSDYTTSCTTQTSYSVAYNLNEGTGTCPTQEAQTGGSTFTLASSDGISKTGYNFAGWNDGENTYNAGDTYTMPNKPVTFTAQWTPIRYIVIFDKNNASATGTMSNQIFDYGTAQNLTQNTFSLTGYTFSGWNTKEDGSGTSYSDKKSVNNLTTTNNATITLYAQWEINTYKVTFNANGGTGSMSTQTFTHGQEQALKANTFTRAHYTFNGWKDGNDNTYTDKQSITLTADLTLYAQWTANTYTITFNAGTGECDTEPITTTNASGVTLPTAYPPTTCDAEGWTFAGWAETIVTETTTEPTLIPAGNYKPTSNITLCAVYSKTETTQGGGTTSTEASLSFASTAQRTSFSSTQQVWEQNGIILTNNKSASTSPVADYSNPARFYASSKIIIEAPGNITQIVFDCNSDSYATAMKNSITGETSLSNDMVTLELDGTSDSYTITSISAQVRIDALTVTYTTSGGGSTTTTYYHSNPECGPQKLATPNVELTYNCSSATITWDAVTNAKAYWYQIIKTGDTNSGTSSTNTTYTRNGIEPGVSYTWSVKTIGDGTKFSDSEIATGTFTAYSIQWLANGELIENACGKAGEEIVVPTPNPASCDGTKEFVGWTATPIDGSIDTEPNDLFTTSPGNINGNATYYAVFATKSTGSGSAELVKMTAYDDFNIGDKIVIIAAGTQYGLYQKTSTSNYIDYWTIQANDGVPTLAEIENDSKRYVEVSAGTANGTIKLGDATNGYLYNSSSTDMSISTNNSSDWSIIAWTDNTFTFEAGQYLSCRTDLSSANKNKWRGAGLSCNCETGNSCSGVIYYNVYKYISGSTTTYSDYTTTCDNTKATITYDLNGGTGATCEQTTVTKDVLFNLCSDAPTKEGYTFAGWSDGTTTYSAGASVTVSESTTFYASWKAKTITITWNLNYTGCPEAETSTYVYEGDEIEMPEDPIRTGYKFNGWYTKATDGTEVTEVGDENKPSADVTYYAQWEKLHTVTFIASGQVYVKQEHKYISGDKLVLPEIDPSAANFACDGYLFEGWSKYQQTKEDANCPELVDANTSVGNELELHAVWKKASASGAGTQIFYESFDTENGTGGNDGKWSGDIAKNSKVNTTWTFENEGGAYKCIKLGSASKKGSATTPALTQLSGDATLSFKAAAWNGNSESTTLKLTISGGGTLTPTSVTLVKGAWNTYEVQITDGTPSSTITFAAANASNNRFFLDEVKITTSGSYNYTTVPNCGPTMVAKENVWVTSANGQSVKVNVPLGIKLFEGNATITGTSTNENFVVNTLENAGNGEHQVVVVYTPIVDDTKENTTITLTAKNGEDTWATTTFVLNGRSLPREFVVVASKGDKNYALPANMPSEGTYTGFGVEVNAGTVIAAPKTHLYTARAVHSTRFTQNGTALRLVGNNDACLWASKAKDGTSIRNYANISNATDSQYEWNLYTEDGETYCISCTAVTEEGRILRMYGQKFGMYKEGVNAFKLLSVGCTSSPMNVQTSTTRTSATISWTNADACNVEVYNGSTKVQTISAASPVVVSKLAESTAYTFTLTPADNESCVASGAFTTTGPTIDIVEWQTGGIRIYVDKDENVNPKVIINGEEEHGNVGGQVATELFFSKYYEAHAENKLLAVYNGTTQTIDLNGYVIKHGTVEIDLSQYGQTKGFIASNEEIILVSFDTDANKSAESCAEKEEGFSSWNVLGTSDLAFSGRGSVGLYKNDVLIDLIGSIYPSGELTKIGKAGKPDYCGTEDDVQLHVDGVSVNDQSSFFCHNGDNIKTPEVETNYPISTNRCLLIRKNTVTSGATAVTSNKAEAGATCGDLSSTFTTLCTEWSGFRIGSGSSSTAEIQDATCEGLGYVGGFDYNNYYRTMETIHTGKTLNDYYKNDKDNTYFIEFDNVSDYSCLNIQLQLTDNDGNVLTDQITQVPILVSDKKTTTSDIFSAIVKDGQNPDYENSKIRCATCDVVILQSATLTKAAPGTAKDVNQVRDIYVYPGGKLIVPEGATDYSVNSLSLRRDQDEVGTATIISPLNITSSLDKPIYADVRINSENWHWFTLPYDCNIADVTWKNGSKAIYNSDWFLMTYNGEQRAATQSGGCWVSYEGTTIEAGKGYIIGITGHPTKSGVQYELRFPMAKEVLTKESDPAGKQVAVNAWGVKENIRPNHKGWNLVGNPYLDSYQPTTSGFKGLSLLKYTEVDPVTGEWYYDKSGTIPYLVTPINGGWYAYEQELASETKMKPLTAYFVQVGDPNNDDHENGEELYANFTPSSRANLPKSIIRRAPSEVNETEEPVIVGVALTNSLGESDKTTLLIADRFTNEYEMNADFFKWFGDYYNYYTKPVLYTIGADQGKRAFNALNEELAKQPIPMGMYAAQAGNYTFSLNQQFDLSRVEEVWLYDATQSTYTNLMQSDYTFSTSKVNGAGRFSLSVKLAPKVATSIDNVTADKVWATTQNQQIIVNGLENGMHLWLYDATGKLLYNEPISNYQHTYVVQQTGTYFVSVMNGNQKQTIKVVVE